MSDFGVGRSLSKNPDLGNRYSIEKLGRYPEDQIAICAKMEIKVQKRNKCPNKKGESQEKRGNKSPNNNWKN